MDYKIDRKKLYCKKKTKEISKYNVKTFSLKISYCSREIIKIYTFNDVYVILFISMWH